MKKILLSFFTFLLLVSIPLSAFADQTVENQQKAFKQDFVLVEKDDMEPQSKDSLKEKAIDPNSSTASAIGGYGTINCWAIGAGKMLCNWSVTLTRSGEAIQNLYMIFDVANSSGNIVGTKEFYAEPLGGNGKTYRNQMDFNPGPGNFTITKYGSVAGRYAVYNVYPVKSASVTVY